MMDAQTRPFVVNAFEAATTFIAKREVLQVHLGKPKGGPSPMELCQVGEKQGMPRNDTQSNGSSSADLFAKIDNMQRQLQSLQGQAQGQGEADADSAAMIAQLEAQVVETDSDRQ